MADDDIIIKGGSVEIEFSDQVFPGQGRKHGNKERKIASVEVSDDNTQRTQTINVPANGKCTIRITTR